ncbi:uncharacterized protein LOC142558007 [Dermacentor variabilis]|uniref:uncharacterized protein LOC142558007 n=1 Tax=Dermacentor variabilis TaxID=34621 RepID=UPI003F5B7F69
MTTLKKSTRIFLGATKTSNACITGSLLRALNLLAIATRFRKIEDHPVALATTAAVVEQTVEEGNLLCTAATKDATKICPEKELGRLTHFVCDGRIFYIETSESLKKLAFYHRNHSVNFVGLFIDSAKDFDPLLHRDLEYLSNPDKGTGEDKVPLVDETERLAEVPD